MAIGRGQRPLEAGDSWSIDSASGRVLYGVGVVDVIGELARELGGRRVLVVTDGGIAAAGHLDRASASLGGAGLDVATFPDAEENPGERNVAAAADAARHHQADLLVGLGGGSAMDCAKGANFVFTNGGRMEDYRGFGLAAKPMLPSIGVPCTAGTGSEAQSFAVIARDGDHRKMACGDPKARFAATLLDPSLVGTAPPEIKAATGLDALSHALESFVCTAANPYSRMFASEGFGRLLRGFEAVAATRPGAGGDVRDERGPAPRALAAPGDEDLKLAGAGLLRAGPPQNCLDQPGVLSLDELWGDMLLGAHLAGAAIEASMLGAAHGLANPLTARYGVTHGVAVAVMLDHVVRFNSESGRGVRYEALSKVVSDNGAGAEAGAGSAGEALAELWVDLRERAGVASRLREMGVPEADLEVLAGQAAEQWTAQYNPRPADASDMLSLYRAAF